MWAKLLPFQTVIFLHNLPTLVTFLTAQKSNRVLEIYDLQLYLISKQLYDYVMWSLMHTGRTQSDASKSVPLIVIETKHQDYNHLQQ